jgi:uncharacterized protein (TIGR03083 family)
MSIREVRKVNDARCVTVLGALSADDWSRPSLCDRWSNHEVLAHLVAGLDASLRDMTGAMARHRGSFDEANAEMARQLAAQRQPADLLDDFARLSRSPRGLGRYFPPRLLLGDHVTHELDIVLALDRPPAVAPEALVAVLGTQVHVPNPFVPAFATARGLRLRSTDVDWRHGTRGPVVEGYAADLVSVLGNRLKALPRLRGDGVAVLEARLRNPTRTGG